MVEEAKWKGMAFLLLRPSRNDWLRPSGDDWVVRAMSKNKITGSPHLRLHAAVWYVEMCCKVAEK
jgi:hypothetical protein